MLRRDIRTAEDMVDYMIDCTLATVAEMAYKKNIKKSEFKRQCDIAQTAIDFLGAKTYDFKGNRCLKFCRTQTVFDYYNKIHEEFLKGNFIVES